MYTDANVIVKALDGTPQLFTYRWRIIQEL